MRILICTGIYPPDIGGPATYSKLLVDELPKRGIEVKVLSFGSVRHLPKIIRHFVYFLKVLKLGRRTDIIFVQDPVSVGLSSLMAAKIIRKKFIIRVAGDYAWEQARQRFGVKDSIDEFQDKKYGLITEFLREIQKFVVNHARAVITPSIYFKNLVSKWIKNSDKSHVIYNGIKLTNAKVYNNKKKEKIILSAGRLVPWKGFNILIEIMKELPEWQLIIVGDGPERSNLENIIKNLELNKRVKLTGTIPREKLLELLSQANIFILNTSFESFSFQVVEAMNAGVPVIATNIGNLSEIIKNGREGALVEPNNKNQIIAAIKKIEEDKNFREMIIKNAHNKVQQFSIENTIIRLEKLLKAL